ncbi:MAG: insulinase family protein [Candidatus Omnitrophica bacterium]|nr:insulinase family protein [Candidatus Omnitrophota bacterium]
MRKLTTLDNKLRIITQRMKVRDSVSVGVWFGVGGRYENSQNKGIAHFMEHLAFKGSRNYSCEQIKQQVEGVGGSLNAFTSEEETCFYAKVPRKHLNKTFDILSDISFFPQITKSDLEKERTVILEEIKMYHDLPQYYVMELLEQLLWPNHPLGEGLAGTSQTVSNLKQADLKAFQQHYYVPDNVVVSLCGDIKHDEVVDVIAKKLAHLKGHKPDRYIPARKTQDTPTGRFYTKDTEQMHLALGFLGYETNHKDYYVLALLSIMLGGNMSSRLFNEVREKRGLAYSIGSSFKSLDDTGVFMVRAGVDNSKIESALDVILKVLRKVARQGVTADELKRGKDYFSGQFLLGLEDTMDHMIWLGAGLMSRDKINTPEIVVQKIQAVTLADIKRVADEILNPQRLNVSLIGPLDEKLESQLRVVAGLSR